MICRIVLGAMVVLTATAAADAGEADSLLDGTRVVPIEITLPAVDWETLRRESRGPVGLFAAGPPQPFTYHRGHAVVDGLAIADVGFRKNSFFGTGPMRIVGGTAALTDRGSDPGSRLGGTFEFTVDETAGGFTNPAAKRRPIDTSRDDPDVTARNNP
jgi:hypothetical protein